MERLEIRVLRRKGRGTGDKITSPSRSLGAWRATSSAEAFPDHSVDDLAALPHLQCTRGNADLKQPVQSPLDDLPPTLRPPERPRAPEQSPLVCAAATSQHSCTVRVLLGG